MTSSLFQSTRHLCVRAVRCGLRLGLSLLPAYTSQALANVRDSVWGREPSGSVLGLLNPYTRRFLGGRQPLCGIGVTSLMERTSMPAVDNARTADSRPEPGPATRTSTVLRPDSFA